MTKKLKKESVKKTKKTEAQLESDYSESEIRKPDNDDAHSKPKINKQKKDDNSSNKTYKNKEEETVDESEASNNTTGQNEEASESDASENTQSGWNNGESHVVHENEKLTKGDSQSDDRRSSKGVEPIRNHTARKFDEEGGRPRNDRFDRPDRFERYAERDFRPRREFPRSFDDSRRPPIRDEKGRGFGVLYEDRLSYRRRPFDDRAPKRFAHERPRDDFPREYPRDDFRRDAYPREDHPREPWGENRIRDYHREERPYYDRPRRDDRPFYDRPRRDDRSPYERPPLRDDRYMDDRYRDFPRYERPRKIRVENPDPSHVLGLFGTPLDVRRDDISDFLKNHVPEIQEDNIVIVQDRFTHRGKGFVFVYFRSIDDAKKAKERISGKRLLDREIRVDYSISAGKLETRTESVDA